MTDEGYGTIEERNRLAQHAIRHDGLEPWKALLFTVCPAAFVEMFEREKERRGLLTSSDG